MTYFVLYEGRPLPANTVNELDQPLRPVEFDNLDEAQEYIADFDEFADTLSIMSVKNGKVIRALLTEELNRGK